jgi:hypothetical protein
MTFDISLLPRELPPEDLRNEPAWKEFQQFGAQWSQLIALFWCEPELTKDKEFTKAEVKLKQDFIKLLKDQATLTQAFLKCDTPSNINDDIVSYSNQIKDYLLDYKPKTDLKTDPLPTLSSLLFKYTGKDLVTAVGDVEDKKTVKYLFKNKINVQVITDSFVGRIIYAAGQDEDSPREDKYILELAYPPRPAFHNTTITEDTLFGWAKEEWNSNNSYKTPPSCYFPWSAC